MIKINDKKFSKSRGYIVWVEDDYLAHGFHPDLLRYYILSYTSHTKDINFSWKEFQTKVNKELVGSFGNFVNRVLTFVESKNVDLKGDIEPSVRDAIKLALDVTKAEIGNYEFKKICDSIITLADFGNTYFQGHEPWKLIKEDPAACESVLYNCAQIVKALAILSWPSMPAKAEEIWGMLGYDRAKLAVEPLEKRWCRTTGTSRERSRSSCSPRSRTRRSPRWKRSSTSVSPSPKQGPSARKPEEKAPGFHRRVRQARHPRGQGHSQRAHQGEQEAPEEHGRPGRG